MMNTALPGEAAASKALCGTVFLNPHPPAPAGPSPPRSYNVCVHSRGLHGLKTEARTRPVPENVWPDPTGTVKFRARNPPQRIANKKKKRKDAFHDCMQRNRLIKALPFHKHLPVMKVCEHQVQRSHTFCRVYEFCMKIILPPYKLWSFFVS